jgi:hypothetical protein
LTEQFLSLTLLPTVGNLEGAQMKFGLTQRKLLGLLLGIGLLVSASGAGAQDDNGIVVGKPKVFDNRTLYIMLDELKTQLRTVQAVDPQKLAQSLGLLQGTQTHDFSFALTLTGAAVPKVTTNEKADSSGNLVPSDRSTEQAAVTPTPPGLPDLLSAPTYSPSFGENSQDLLADQVSLSYQIFNIRLLLERSLSDRLIDKDPRLQALLGFSISLDPAKRMRDRAAYVEIRVKGAPGTPGASLVSMMPFEKTYNAAALDTSSRSFGGSAVAKVFTVGVNARSRSQTFYLYRDADTLALERPSGTDPTGSVVTFGWEFRPVLGRRSVSPGSRQMFAVLALPVADKAETLRQTLQVEVRTYWRPYHRRTLSTKQKIEYDSKWQPLGTVTVYNSREFERQLAPIIETVHWSPTDSNTAVFTLSGANFFSGTRVLVGSSTFDASSKDFLIKSDNTIELRTNLRDVAAGEAVVSGRYGGVPLQLYKAPEGSQISSGMLINSMEFRGGVETSLINIDLQDRKGEDLVFPLEEKPLVIVGDTYVPGPYDMQPMKCKARPAVPSPEPWPSRGCYRLTAAVPSSLLSKAAVVSVRLPFRDQSWADTWPVDSPRKVTGLTRLGGDPDTTLAITGRNLKGVRVLADHTYFEGGSYPLLVNDDGTLATIKIKTKVLEKYGHLVVEVPKHDPVLLEVPPAPSGGKAAAEKGKKSEAETPAKACTVKTACPDAKDSSKKAG